MVLTTFSLSLLDEDDTYTSVMVIDVFLCDLQKSAAQVGLRISPFWADPDNREE